MPNPKGQKMEKTDEEMRLIVRLEQIRKIVDPLLEEKGNLLNRLYYLIEQRVAPHSVTSGLR
jgi:hypothetical protein